MTAPQLIQLSESNRAALARAIATSFDAKELKSGSAWAGYGSDFFFPIETSAKPLLLIDGARYSEMEHLDGTDLWYAKAHIPQLGKLHSFQYVVNGVKFGGSADVPAFGPLSYLQPGVPSGRLSNPTVHTSRIYDGMKSEYWVYAPAQ